MSFTHRGRTLNKIAVIGSGQIGPDIALFFTKVFSPFGQVEEPLTRTYQGTGLGLPITNAFIKLHGGELKMNSRQGEGTVVTIVFPPERTIVPHDRPAAMPAPASD